MYLKLSINKLTGLFYILFLKLESAVTIIEYGLHHINTYNFEYYKKF